MTDDVKIYTLTKTLPENPRGIVVESMSLFTTVAVLLQPSTAFPSQAQTLERQVADAGRN